MSFKDQIKQDLSDVFLNLDEFADLHRIEGKEVPVVIDSDMLEKLSKIGDNRIHGMDEADMVIMGKASDLPENLDPGRLLNLDGREVIVVTTTSEMGLVQIAVRQNRMSHCSTHGLQKWIEKNIIFKRKEMADIELPQEVTQWELNQF